MNQLVTEAIVLSRTNYGEADRIVKLLTPDVGKLSLVARGVRKPKSKLAGGIELFSVSQLTYIRGRGDLGTLISARLDRHYGDIVKQIERVQLGYDLIKLLDRATEDQPEAEYFELLQTAFAALNEPSIDTALIRQWFHARLIALAGHSPNLITDTADDKLVAERHYNFDFDAMALSPNDNGRYGADHIKYLRLLFAGNLPQTLQQVRGATALIEASSPLTQTMLTSFIRV